jgi:TonB family protein
MIENVTDIIAARSRPVEGLNRMVIVSVIAHAGVVTTLLLTPQPSFREDAPKTVMTISLGGAPGPRAGGMTQIGGRPIQAVEPPPPPQQRRADSAPAPTRPTMTLPTKDARVRPQARPNTAPKEATEGSAKADTGARGRGFGLSTGGGGGTGATLDVGDFCCPEYLELMHQRIQQNWAMNQGVTAKVVVKFTIMRSGEITAVRVERPSGFMALDMAASRAVSLAKLPALPAQFPNPSLTVNLIFDYQR